MKDILPIPMQCKSKNESVSSYALHAGAGTNHILISIHVFKYLLDFTSSQVKSYKQLQVYENEQFQLELDQLTSCIFQVRYHGLF